MVWTLLSDYCLLFFVSHCELFHFKHHNSLCISTVGGLPRAHSLKTNKMDERRAKTQISLIIHPDRGFAVRSMYNYGSTLSLCQTGKTLVRLKIHPDSLCLRSMNNYGSTLTMCQTGKTLIGLS